MVINEIRENLPDESVVFDNPSFDNSIIGISHDDRIIYYYNYMVQEMMSDERISEDDAVDFIEYNTIRSIPYGGEYAPIVLYNI